MLSLPIMPATSAAQAGAHQGSRGAIHNTGKAASHGAHQCGAKPWLR